MKLGFEKYFLWKAPGLRPAALNGRSVMRAGLVDTPLLRRIRESKDAMVLSPHKFIGGPSTPAYS